MSAAIFFVRSFASLVFLEYSTNTLLWGQFQAQTAESDANPLPLLIPLLLLPPSTTLLLCKSPLKYGPNSASEQDSVSTAVEAVGGLY